MNPSFTSASRALLHLGSPQRIDAAIALDSTKSPSPMLGAKIAVEQRGIGTAFFTQALIIRRWTPQKRMKRPTRFLPSSW